MIHKTGVVPAKYVIALGIPVSVFVQNLLIKFIHGFHLVRRERAVEFIKSPCDSSFWNSFEGNEAVADFFVYKSEFSVRVDHRRIIVVMSVKDNIKRR